MIFYSVVITLYSLQTHPTWLPMKDGQIESQTSRLNGSLFTGIRPAVVSSLVDLDIACKSTIIESLDKAIEFRIDICLAGDEPAVHHKSSHAGSSEPTGIITV